MCCRHFSFFFLACLKVVLMSVYHFIPGPTLGDYSPASRHSRAGAIWRAVSKPRPTTSSSFLSILFYSFLFSLYYSASSNVGKSSFLHCFFPFWECSFDLQHFDKIYRVRLLLLPTIFGNYFKGGWINSPLKVTTRKWESWLNRPFFACRNGRRAKTKAHNTCSGE